MRRPCASAVQCAHHGRCPLPHTQVGSVFEYANQRPIFDVIYPGSPLYTPILGFFAVTGLPTAGAPRRRAAGGGRRRRAGAARASRSAWGTQTPAASPPSTLAGFLFFKAVQTANAEAERMDKMDGY